MKIWLRGKSIWNRDFTGMGRIYMALSRTFAKMGIDYMLDCPYERCIELCIGDEWQYQDLFPSTYRNYLICFTTGETLLDNMDCWQEFDCFFVTSKYYKDLQTIDKPIYIWHLGIEPELHSYIERKNKKFIFSHIGITQYRKGSHLACQAFSEVLGNKDDVELHVICQDSEVELFKALRQMYQEQSNIKFIPMAVPLERLSDLYYGDCLLFPSLREGWGLHLTEAMATGMPAIVSDIRVLDEQFTDDCGWRVKVDDIGYDGCAILNYDDLCEKINYVVEHRDECVTKGRYAYNHAHTNLTWEIGIRNSFLPIIEHIYMR